jgi:hypothetical protein
VALLALVCAGSVVFGGISRFRSAQREADAALPVVEPFVPAGARNDPAAALARFATARDPAVTAERIAALFAERRAVFTGVQVVEQTSFTISRTTRGTTALIQGRLTYADTPARAWTAQLVQEQGAWRLVSISFADGVGGGGVAWTMQSVPAVGRGRRAEGGAAPRGGRGGMAPCFGRTAWSAGRARVVGVGPCEAVWMADGVS